MPRDKRDQELKAGDHVHFVHFGEEHTAEVRDTGEELHSPHLGNVPYVVVLVEATVPASFVEKIEAPTQASLSRAKPAAEPSEKSTTTHSHKPTGGQ